MTEDDVYWCSLLGIAEMLLSGTTAFADMYFFTHRTAEAVLETGIRGNLAGTCMDIAGDGGRLDRAEGLIRDYGHASPLLRMAFAPHAVYTCSPPYLKQIAARAEAMDAALHIHNSETLREMEDCRKDHDCTPTELLRDTGILHGRGLLAHCVHCTEEDRELIAESRFTVASCPVSNCKLGSGIAPLPSMLRRGLSVSLGTDGAASNNNLSMMKELSFASLLYKGVSLDPLALSPVETLRLATRADALGFADGGHLAPGFQADIVLIDQTAVHSQPNCDPLDQLTYANMGSDVRDVWVAGRQLVRDGRCTTIDTERVCEEVRRVQARITEGL